MKIKEGRFESFVYNDVFEIGDLVDVKCDLCGSQDGELLYREGDFGINKCSDCGLVYVSPQPTEESLEKYYKGYYKDTSAQAQDTWVRPHSFNQLRRIIRKEGYNSGNLLDVGCGFGSFLRTMHGPGWKLTGIELDHDAAKIIKQNNQEIEVISGDFVRHVFDKKFDVITSIASLEHMKSPALIVNKAYEILNSGGMVLIKVPYVEIFLRMRKYMDLGVYMSAPHHLFDFSPLTLSKYLEKAGFKDINIYVGSGEYVGGLLGRQCVNMVKAVSKTLYYLSFRKYVFPFCGSIVATGKK